MGVSRGCIAVDEQGSFNRICQMAPIRIVAYPHPIHGPTKVITRLICVTNTHRQTDAQATHTEHIRYVKIYL